MSLYDVSGLMDEVLGDLWGNAAMHGVRYLLAQ
jgi:hypothetical protein